MAEDVGIATTVAALEILRVSILRCRPCSLHCSTRNFIQRSFCGKSKAGTSIFPVLGLSVGVSVQSVHTVALCGRKGEKKNAPFPTKV